MGLWDKLYNTFLLIYQEGVVLQAAELDSQNYQAHTDHKQYDCQVGLLSVTASQFS